MYVNAVNIKNHIFFHTNIFRNCIPSSVYLLQIYNERIVKTNQENNMMI